MVTVRWPLGRAIALSQFVAGAFLLGLVALPQLPGAAAFLALSSFCTGPLTVWPQTLRMRLIPAHLRGRVFGLLRTSMQAAPPLGGLAASALLSGPGLRLAVLATALLIGVPGGAHDVPHPARRGRGRSAAGRARHPPIKPELLAARPNQVWSWDIERHEALSNRAVVKGHRLGLVAASH